jgi:hypothetical protein
MTPNVLDGRVYPSDEAVPPDVREAYDQRTRVIVKNIIVAAHLLLLSAAYWLMRDFPDLKMRPKSPWMTFTGDVLAILICVVAIGLICGFKWARWTALAFYAWITFQVGSSWVRALLNEGMFLFDLNKWEVTAEFTFLSLFKCFPLPLLIRRRSTSPSPPSPSASTTA